MSFEYLRAVTRDFKQLGLAYDAREHGATESWRTGELYQLVHATSKISRQNQEQLRHSRFAPKTRIGKKVLRAITGPHFKEFNPAPKRLMCCDDAESILLANVSNESVNNTAFRAPIIIHDNMKPVAILKTSREPSVYALTSRSQRGLLQAAFSEPTIPLQKVAKMDSLMGTTTAWSLALSEAGDFSPLRYSVLALPATERACLLPNSASPRDELILRASHQLVMRQAEYLLQFAAPL